MVKKEREVFLLSLVFFLFVFFLKGGRNFSLSGKKCCPPGNEVDFVVISTKDNGLFSH